MSARAIEETRVLLVEDEPGLAIALRMLFERLGHVVLHASSIAGARVALSARRRPHLVVLDFAQDRSTAETIDFCRSLKGRRPSFAILGLVGLWQDHEFRKEILEACVDLLFTTPFDAGALEHAAVRLLDKRRSEGARH